jgi:hypothetical protein
MYGTGSATNTVEVVAASQTISFTGLPSTATYVSGLSYALTATASSGLAVSYAVTGPATISGSTLDITGPGTVKVTASQAGNNNNNAAKSVTRTISVGAPALPSANISLQFASMQLVYPGATNITVCVTSAKKVAATGSVELYDGTTLLTTQTLEGGGCAYWYISPGLSVGTHSITASYSGDKNNAAGTSAAATLTVTPVPVTLIASCWNPTFVYGINYNCSVSASSNAGLAQGSITYTLDGGTPVSAALTNGIVTFVVAKPPVGSHTLAIRFATQNNYGAAATQNESFSVTPAPVKVSLKESASSVSSGTSVTFTAAVTSPTGGTPNSTGSVTFFDGTTSLASVAVDANGQAVYTTTSLASGTHTIKATFAGSTNYNTGSATTSISVH